MFSNLPAHDDDRAVLVRLAVGGPDPQAAELILDRLFELGATGVEERDAPGGDALLLAGFPNRSAAGAALAQLGPALQAQAIVDVPDDTWFDGWRAHARPHRAGRHVIVHPPWIPRQAEPPVGPDDLVVDIDPGRAFGSGAHPTTRLVLAELERLVGHDDRVLDVGCGSGVLAITAARLGAASVVAIDTDPAARDATRANQARNGVEFPVLDRLDDLDRLDELGFSAEEPRPNTRRPSLRPAPFELVLANIGANTLIELAPTLAARGARLVLSGFFADRCDEVAVAYARCGAKELNRLVEGTGGWTALTVGASPA